MYEVIRCGCTKHKCSSAIVIKPEFNELELRQSNGVYVGAMFLNYTVTMKLIRQLIRMAVHLKGRNMKYKLFIKQLGEMVMEEVLLAREAA